MSCFSELLYHTYLDGELPFEERRAVETHLGECPRCQALVEALRAEHRLLLAALEEPEEVAAPAPTRPLDLLWTAVAVLAAAAGLQVAAGWVSGGDIPSGMEWLNPLSLSGQLNLLFGTLFYLVREGATMLVSSFTAVSILVAGLVVVGAGVLLVRRRPAALAVFVTLAVMLGLAQPGAALERRKANNVIIAQNETLDDTLVAFGETVTVDGTVTGNVIAFAKRVVVNGTVRGDLISFAERVELGGKVEGNAITASQFLTVRGQVMQSLHGFANIMEATPESRVAGDGIFFVNVGQLNGALGRDLVLMSSMTEVRGQVGRNVLAKVDRLTLLSSARVGGDVKAYCEKKGGLHVDPGATVGGKTETIVPPPKESEYAQPKFYAQKALGIGIAFVIGWLLYWLFPALFAAELRTAAEAAKTVGIGFLALVATPVAACVVGIVLLGIGAMADVFLIASLIPLITIMLWLLAIYICKVFVALLLGRALLRAPAGFAVPLLLGLVLVIVGFNLPYVGKVLHFLVWLLGLGIMTLQTYRHYLSRPARAAA
jgi:anti-sigma factor RsiW